MIINNIYNEFSNNLLKNNGEIEIKDIHNMMHAYGIASGQGFFISSLKAIIDHLKNSPIRVIKENDLVTILSFSDLYKYLKAMDSTFDISQSKDILGLTNYKAKIKYLYQRWMGQKVLQDVETSLKVLDSYNKTRFSRRKGSKENLILESAKHAHENSLIYFVTKIIDEQPECHLEINQGFYRVIFLDKLKRGYITYDFQGKSDLTDWRREIPSDKLFLSQVVEKKFQSESDKIIQSHSYIFRPNGILTIVEQKHLTKEQIERTSKLNIDVSGNWEDFPEFGKYDAITVFERNLTLND